MPLNAAEEQLLESHEERIRSLEGAIVAVANDIRPALARLDTSMQHMHEKVDHVQEDIETTRDQLVEGSKTFADHEYRLKSLERRRAERRERAKSAAKWAGGIVGGIVVALILSWLGLG